MDVMEGGVTFGGVALAGLGDFVVALEQPVEGLDQFGDGALRDEDAVGQLFIQLVLVPRRQQRQERRRLLALVARLVLVGRLGVEALQQDAHVLVQLPANKKKSRSNHVRSDSN